MFVVRCLDGKERTGKLQRTRPWVPWLLVMRCWETERQQQPQLSLVFRRWQHRQLSLVSIWQRCHLSPVVIWCFHHLSLVVTCQCHHLSLVISRQCHQRHCQCVSSHRHCHQVMSWRRRAVLLLSMIVLSTMSMTRKLRRVLLLPSLTGTIMLVVSNNGYSSQLLQLKNNTIQYKTCNAPYVIYSSRVFETTRRWRTERHMCCLSVSIVIVTLSR